MSLDEDDTDDTCRRRRRRTKDGIGETRPHDRRVRMTIPAAISL